MKNHTLFVIFKKAVKFEIVVGCKLYVAIKGLIHVLVDVLTMQMGLDARNPVAMLIAVFSDYVTFSITSGFVSLCAIGLLVICDSGLSLSYSLRFLT